MRLRLTVSSVKADVAELKDQNTLMTKRMDKMDASLTTLHKNRKQDRDILKFIASKMDKDKTFVSDDEGDEDDSLTPWDDVDETPAPRYSKAQLARLAHYTVFLIPYTVCHLKLLYRFRSMTPPNEHPGEEAKAKGRRNKSLNHVQSSVVPTLSLPIGGFRVSVGSVFRGRISSHLLP